jgi:hypothetical protein
MLGSVDGLRVGDSIGCDRKPRDYTRARQYDNSAAPRLSRASRGRPLGHRFRTDTHYVAAVRRARVTIVLIVARGQRLGEAGLRWPNTRRGECLQGELYAVQLGLARCR